MSKVELEEKWLSERIFELKYILYGPVEYDFEKAEDEVQRLKKIMEMSTEQRNKIEKELDSLSKQLSLLRVEQYVTN